MSKVSWKLGLQFQSLMKADAVCATRINRGSLRIQGVLVGGKCHFWMEGQTTNGQFTNEILVAQSWGLFPLSKVSRTFFWIWFDYFLKTFVSATKQPGALSPPKDIIAYFNATNTLRINDEAEAVRTRLGGRPVRANDRYFLVAGIGGRHNDPPESKHQCPVLAVEKKTVALRVVSYWLVVLSDLFGKNKRKAVQLHLADGNAHVNRGKHQH
jgi:hypothetical protein